MSVELADIYVDTGKQAWLPFFPGFTFKVLRVSAETGTWTVLIKSEPGASFPSHTHLGAGEYYMVSGRMEVRGGAQNGGITAQAGDYGFEPNGIVHDHTEFPLETVLFFTNHGAVNFTDEAGRSTFVLDWQAILKLEADGKQALQKAA
jgi:quercetin dioxygenase-like cupin family protein